MSATAHTSIPEATFARQDRRASTAVEDAFERLAGARVRNFAPGTEIFAEGQAADYVYRIVEGVVRTCRLLSDGRRQVCDFLNAGDVLGPEANLVHRSSAEAVTPVRVQVVSRGALAQRAEADPVLSRDLWRLAVDWFQRSQDHALILARQGATERLAGFLVAYADRQGVQGELDLPMTRQDIGDYLGLTIHTVSRTLSQLHADGLVELTSLRHLRLSGEDELRAMSA
jgi:CRP-like cAMP-binding protein